MVTLSEVAETRYGDDDGDVRVYYQVTDGEVDLEPDALSQFLRAVVDGRDGECDGCRIHGDDAELRIAGESEPTDKMPRPDTVVFYLDSVSLTCPQCPSDGPGVSAPYEGGLGGAMRRDGQSVDSDWGKSPDEVGPESTETASESDSERSHTRSDSPTEADHSTVDSAGDASRKSNRGAAQDKNVAVRDDGVPIYEDEGRIAFDLMDPDEPGGKVSESPSSQQSSSAHRSSTGEGSATRLSHHPILSAIGNTLNEIRIMVLGFVTGLLLPGWIAAVKMTRLCESHRNVLAGVGVVGAIGIAGAVFVIPDWPVTGVGGWGTVPTRPSDLGVYGIASLLGGVYVTVLWAAWELQTETAVPAGDPADISAYRQSLFRRLAAISAVALGLIVLAGASVVSPVSVLESEFAIASVVFGTGCYLVTGLTAHRALVSIGPALPTIFGINIGFYRAVGHVLIGVCPWLWIAGSTVPGRVVTILLPVVYCAGVLGLLRQYSGVTG